MKKIAFLILAHLLTYANLFSQEKKEWFIEAEDRDTKITYKADGVIDIIAPKGVTLWNRNQMQGNVTIEYDARIVVEDNNNNEWNRLSDLNCFWMASDPEAAKGDVRIGASKRNGVFTNQYALSFYYLGYGGNHNTTTRFRKYNGNKKGVTQKEFRPSILREFTDAEHLLKPNHWYHIQLEQQDGHVRYIIDGECIVDYLDLKPLTSGYFGFRTTLSHSQMRNFKYQQSSIYSNSITLRWLENGTNNYISPQTFSVPFAKGELTDGKIPDIRIKSNGKNELTNDTWTLARWDDGSIKWQAFAAVIPPCTDSCTIDFTKEKHRTRNANAVRLVKETPAQIIVKAGNSSVFIPLHGDNVIDSIVTDGVKTMGKAWIELNNKHLKPTKACIERAGKARTTIKLDGECFTMRLYAYGESNEIKIVHTLIVDSALNSKGISSLGMRAKIAMHDDCHKRFISFTKDNKGNYMNMQVKPLIARRPIVLNDDGEPANEQSKRIINNIASWDGFRLSQLSPNAFSIRKRATSISPWIGTIEGKRCPGTVVISDTHSSVSLTLKDFWQSYPSTIQIDDARSNEATASLWMWSPESEKMCFEHYDTIAHTLDAAYEDVQEGMSTAYGIARTSTIFLNTSTDNLHASNYAMTIPEKITSLLPYDKHIMPSTTYLHQKKAFGIWSLYEGSDEDKEIDRIIDFYDNEIERHSWYGYFNYGDVMHSYDAIRDEWRYDVGGYAWDNTELGTNAMFWYAFLRKGDAKTWRIAEAMTKHTSEVDCYHIGPNAGLGSRHNVLHWGCGAKEARISQAFWNRFLYYLTADERCGDLMSEVRDADKLLYSLDPMRLAQPRSQFPCTAPARLRIGPDWLAYAGNWFTEWERTGNKLYFDKIIAGMSSIANLPHGIFSGPKALGYDPATGIITWEGDTAKQNTNHLLAIMGGFEMMNEMMISIDNKEWNKVWLDHATNYKQKALTISNNKFRIPRLQAYSYWKTGQEKTFINAWNDLSQNSPFKNKEHFFTNDAATWTLDAIFMQEIAKKRKKFAQ